MMNMNEDTLQSADQHQQISLLLPWYLNKSLALTERQQVETHIRDCMVCRRELAHLDKLAAMIKQAPDLDVAAKVSFDKLRAKWQTDRQPIESLGGTQPDLCFEKCIDRLSGNTAPRRPFLGMQGIRLAIPVSVLLAIAPFAMQYGRSPTAKDYHTLSDAKPESVAGIHLSVVFSKPMAETEINALLAKIHGERVAGPNSDGAYTVRLNSGKDTPNLASAIVFLRGQQHVMLANPVLPP